MNDTELLKKIHAQIKNHRKSNLSNQLMSEILNHEFDDFSASTGERVFELEKQNAELRKEQGSYISMKARAEILNNIMLGMIDPELEYDEKVTGSDWDYVDDETYKKWVKLLQAHNLEQQANGIEEYADSLIKSFKEVKLVNDGDVPMRISIVNILEKTKLAWINKLRVRVLKDGE